MPEPTIYSIPWCGYCKRLLSQLDREGVAYTAVDIERDEDAAAFVKGVNGGNQTVRTVVYAVLRDVGRTLARSLRSCDLVVRYGGDEFLCALSGVSVADAAARLTTAAHALAALPGAASFPVGLAERLPGDTVQALVGRADADLYAQRLRRA